MYDNCTYIRERLGKNSVNSMAVKFNTLIRETRFGYEYTIGQNGNIYYNPDLVLFT